MNIKEKIVNNPLFNKITIVLAVFFLSSIFYIFIRSVTRGPRTQLTVPVIPTIVPTGPVAPLETDNPFNPTQGLIFNWGTVIPNIPDSVPSVRISSPLINSVYINSAASALGFTTQDYSQESDNQNFIWVNERGSFFGSTTQNQIFYNSSEPVSIHAATYTKDQALQIAKNYISNIFGNSTLNSFNPNPEVRYLSINIALEEEPRDTTPEIANIINVNFHQEINSLPLINLSKKGETVSITFDTTGKLYRLYVHGGYVTTSSSETITPPSYETLQQLAPTNAIRISQSESVESESQFTDADSITINVSSVGTGYFQRSDNDLFPVFVIIGVMSAPGLAPYPATYIVPFNIN